MREPRAFVNPEPNLRLFRLGPLVRATVDNCAVSGDARMHYPELSFWGFGEYMATQRALRFHGRQVESRRQFQAYVDNMKRRLAT